MLWVQQKRYQKNVEVHEIFIILKERISNEIIKNRDAFLIETKKHRFNLYSFFGFKSFLFDHINSIA